MNLTLASDGQQARLFVQPRAALPPGFLREAGFETSSQPVFPWYGHGFPGATGAAVAPPSVEVVADSVTDGRRHVQLRVARVLRRRFARIGEEAHRRLGVEQQDVPEARQRFDGGIGVVRRAFQLQVLTVTQGGVSHVGCFFDVALFRAFGLPDTYPG